jgi:carbonic anhydrase
MPGEVGDKEKLSRRVDANKLLPGNDHDYCRFNGSLTIQPCSEGVAWFGINSPILYLNSN